MRTVLALSISILLLIALAVGGVAWWVTRPGNTDQLTQYLGQQVASIANTYLVPDLAFEHVEFERPGTLTLSDVSLTAPDGTAVVALSTMVVELDELPARDKPIRIARIRIEDGTVRILREPTGGFRGLVPFVERGVSDEEEANIDEQTRLSNVLVLERLEIDDLDIEIDLDDGGGPIRIDGFELAMDVNQAPVEGAGWYELSFTSGRAPGLEVGFDGRLNVDTFAVSVASLTGSIDLTEQTYGSLPERLADPLRERDARGRLQLSATGALPLTDPLGLASSLDATLTLTDFNLATGAYRLPVEHGDVRATLRSGIFDPAVITLSTLGGTLDASGSIHLIDAGTPADLSWTATALDLEQLLRTGGPDAPDLAGIVSGAGAVSTALADPLANPSGSGTIELREGRLVAIPVLTQLAQVASIAQFGDDATRNHRLDAEFTLTPRGVQFDRCEVTTTALAARATGILGYFGSLDLSVNAGPLEKVQSLLGGIGDVLGAITDQLVTYRIKGTTDNPEVTLAPLGIGG